MPEIKSSDIPVLPWPAVPMPTTDEVYKGLSEQAREYPSWLETQVHWRDVGKKPEKLNRIRVLDCSIKMNIGHWCSSLFAEHGAEVIMVEPPGGDPTRKHTPFGRKELMFKDSVTGEAVGGKFLHECRNKLSITLNLETAEGRELLKKLVVDADVLIENYPPGQFDAWGIGYRQLSQVNPRLVYCWVGQRGQWGPLKDRPWMYDPVAQNCSGFTHGTGAPVAFGGRPTRSGFWVCDHIGGTTAAMGIMAALNYRERISGRGQFVESTGAACMIRIIDYNWGWQGMDGSVRPRFGNWDLAINIYAVNPCKDGQIMVGGGHDRLWFRIWKTVGKDRPELEQHIIEDPALKVVVDRLPFYAQVETYTTLSEWFKDNTRLEAETKLQAEEVASGGVTFTDEVAEFPHFKYRGHVMQIDDMLYGKVLHAPPPQLAQKAPPRLKWIGRPTGYDNEEVYRRIFGFKKDDMDRLKKQGVI
jgi:crotonobetainyl-CoA:carnitine CoA-transferase CaiB-like acyl-CoA transferase